MKKLIVFIGLVCVACNDPMDPNAKYHPDPTSNCQAIKKGDYYLKPYRDSLQYTVGLNVTGPGSGKVVYTWRWNVGYCVTFMDSLKMKMEYEGGR
jgi:hypothetical protein